MLCGFVLLVGLRFLLSVLFPPLVVVDPRVASRVPLCRLLPVLLILGGCLCLRQVCCASALVFLRSWLELPRVSFGVVPLSLDVRSCVSVLCSTGDRRHPLGISARSAVKAAVGERSGALTA